ncbi:polysaccharide pyruvyl transferase family protein [Empedobacter sp. GD03861]|uniref:polysaccharide pyruvyl transferase family protein n=1 Tax=Empedobacter sp. GD03861 TaxID=2975390 RepID=UPI0024476CBF|nr:polysaccharide pyruvyl transferase family protein [Empedobacter sp. GD03861]MDH0675680.1 polysaccharide pyruvyl transferase family protein [Empedobacter sp. GD03861]
MNNNYNILLNNLKNKIYNTLDKLINDDYSLLDIPDYNNIGDNLIWQGELDYLKRLSFKKLYEANYWIYKNQNVPKDGILLIQGGGNFGDLYSVSQELKLNLIKTFTDRRIIIFPQTIHYNFEQNLIKDIEILKNHPDLHICLRDLESYNLLKKFDIKNLYLLPDMAFCLDLSKYVLPTKSEKVLLMKRKDKEINTSLNYEAILKQQNVDILDWPTFNISKNKHRINYRIERYNKKLSLFLLEKNIFTFFVDTRYGLKSRKQREKYIETGIKFMNKYSTVYTTRLHGLILAVLLEKKVIIIDNKHKKLSRYYNMWLKDFENISIYNE